LPARRSTRASRDLRPMLRPPTVEWGGAIREGGGKRNLLRTPSSAATSCATARQVQPRISFSMCLIPWSPHVSHAVRHFPFHKQRGDPCPFFSFFTRRLIFPFHTQGDQTRPSSVTPDEFTKYMLYVTQWRWLQCEAYARRHGELGFWSMVHDLSCPQGFFSLWGKTRHLLSKYMSPVEEVCGRYTHPGPQLEPPTCPSDTSLAPPQTPPRTARTFNIPLRSPPPPRPHPNANPPPPFPLPSRRAVGSSRPWCTRSSSSTCRGCSRRSGRPSRSSCPSSTRSASCSSRRAKPPPLSCASTCPQSTCRRTSKQKRGGLRSGRDADRW